MKKLVITLVCMTAFTQFNLQASADLGELRQPLGSKEDCKNLETNIKALDKKSNKNKGDIEKLHTQQYHYTTQKCDEKLKKKLKNKSQEE